MPRGRSHVVDPSSQNGATPRIRRAGDWFRSRRGRDVLGVDRRRAECCSRAATRTADCLPDFDAGTAEILCDQDEASRTSHSGRSRSRSTGTPKRGRTIVKFDHAGPAVDPPVLRRGRGRNRGVGDGQRVPPAVRRTDPPARSTRSRQGEGPLPPRARPTECQLSSTCASSAGLAAGGMRRRVSPEHEARFRRILADFEQRPGGDYAELLRRGQVVSPPGVDIEAWRAGRERVSEDMHGRVVLEAGGPRDRGDDVTGAADVEALAPSSRRAVSVPSRAPAGQQRDGRQAPELERRSRAGGARR